MKRGEYLADDRVAGFTHWASQLITEDLKLEHRWKNRRRPPLHYPLRCAGKILLPKTTQSEKPASTPQLQGAALSPPRGLIAQFFGPLTKSPDLVIVWLCSLVRGTVKAARLTRAVPPIAGKRLTQKSLTTSLHRHCNAMTRYATVTPAVTLEADHAARSIQ